MSKSRKRRALMLGRDGHIQSVGVTFAGVLSSGIAPMALTDAGWQCAWASTAEQGLAELVDVCRNPDLTERDVDVVIRGFVAGVKRAASEGRSWP